MTENFRFEYDADKWIPSEEAQEKFMNEMALRTRNSMITKIIHMLDEVDTTCHEDMNILLEAICAVAVCLKNHHEADSTPEGIASLKDGLVSGLATCFDYHFEGFGENNDS